MIVYTDIDNKIKKISDILEKWGETWDCVAYMGDAENDVECLKKAGISGCPKDAIEEVLNLDLSYVSSKNGGDAAVYDFVINCLLKRIENGN